MRIIAEDADFYAAPRISPNGRRLLFMEWQEGSMPWDATSVCLVEFDSNGEIASTQRVLPNDSKLTFNYQAFQWIDDESFYYISDAEDFWKIYKYDLKTRMFMFSLLAN